MAHQLLISNQAGQTTHLQVYLSPQEIEDLKYCIEEHNRQTDLALKITYMLVEAQTQTGINGVLSALAVVNYAKGRDEEPEDGGIEYLVSEAKAMSAIAQLQHLKNKLPDDDMDSWAALDAVQRILRIADKDGKVKVTLY